jgi:thiamine monophosphate synthase
MSTTNFTDQDLAELEKAIATGVKTVKYTDKEITYRTMDEMLAARDIIRMALGHTKNPRGARRVAQTDSGC